MLVRWADLATPETELAALREIFFQSSSRTVFASEREREAFLEKWTAYYIDHCPADLWLWREKGGEVSGYLTGCHDSAGARQQFEAIASYGVFADKFSDFPAHFHVNCRNGHRNCGVGARLVDVFAGECLVAGLPGVHIVTAPSARNVGFYHRQGFDCCEQRSWNGVPLLFMGRRLTV
ncbi:N-acetyltransferase [uncultured Gammaproteobacteria bacterium]